MRVVKINNNNNYKGRLYYENFFSWDGWNAINALTQIVIAIVAIIAIVVTLKQIGSNKKPNLYLDFKFGLGLAKYEDQSNKVIYGGSIKIANCGISPVFITNAGIHFVRDKEVITGILSTEPGFFLQPGEERNVSIQMMDILFEGIEEKVSASDKAEIYVDIGTGDTITKQLEYDYTSFNFEYKKIKKRAEQSNK